MQTIHFARPDGKDLQIEIIKYQPEDLSRNRTPDRHRHAFHSIFFITAGTSLQEIDFEEYALAANQVMLIPQGSVHWEKETKNLSGYTILFKDEFFSKPQQQLLDALTQYAVALGKLLIPIEAEETLVLKTYFELLYAEQDLEGNQNHTFILQNLMLALINKLEGYVQKVPEMNSFLTHRRPFQRFISLVEESYKEHKNLDFYAAELQVTKRKLNESIKQITGQTAANYIIDRILLEAKRELCFSEKSIKEIAFQLGYDSQYYFSRLFKNRTGKSPEQFRVAYAE